MAVHIPVQIAAQTAGRAAAQTAATSARVGARVGASAGKATAKAGAKAARKAGSSATKAGAKTVQKTGQGAARSATKAGGSAGRKAAETAGKGSRKAAETAGKGGRKAAEEAGKGARSAGGKAGKGAQGGARGGLRTMRESKKKLDEARNLRDRLKRGGNQDGEEDRRRDRKKKAKGGIVGRGARGARGAAAKELRGGLNPGDPEAPGLDAADRLLARARPRRPGRTGLKVVKSPAVLLRRLARSRLTPWGRAKRMRKRVRRVLLLVVLLVLLLLGSCAAVTGMIMSAHMNEVVGTVSDPIGTQSASSGGQLTGMPCRQVVTEASIRMGMSFDPVPCADVFNHTAAVLDIDPRMLAAISFKETNFRSDLISCRRDSGLLFDPARGIMQLRQMTIDHVVNNTNNDFPDFEELFPGLGPVDACDPHTAIPVAAMYITRLGYEKFGSWELALAAYNWGPYALESHLNARGGTPNWGVMPCETRNYVHGTVCTSQYGPLLNVGVMGHYDRFQTMFPDSSGYPAGPGSPIGSTDPVSQQSITREMQALLDDVIPRFGRGVELGCYRSDNGAHGSGKACDYSLSPTWTNTMPTDANRDHGHRLAEYLVANADRLNVDCVIWWGRIWRSDGDPKGHRDWLQQRAYRDYGNLTLNHYDHIHVSVRPRAGHGRC